MTESSRPELNGRYVPGGDFSASTVESISASITPSRKLPFRPSTVRRIRLVLPEPGEDMRFKSIVFVFRSRSRTSAASLMLSARISSFTSMSLISPLLHLHLLDGVLSSERRVPPFSRRQDRQIAHSCHVGFIGRGTGITLHHNGCPFDFELAPSARYPCSGNQNNAESNRLRGR